MSEHKDGWVTAAWSQAPELTQAQLAKRKLTELGDNFSDACIEAGMRLLTPGERARFARLLRRAE